jgi:hypothetical protein
MNHDALAPLRMRNHRLWDTRFETLETPSAGSPPFRPRTSRWPLVGDWKRTAKRNSVRIETVLKHGLKPPAAWIRGK